MKHRLQTPWKTLIAAGGLAAAILWGTAVGGLAAPLDDAKAAGLIGENPDFYGGHPVELNLNISGKLDQILDRGLAGYRIPETIRKRLGDFEE